MSADPTYAIRLLLLGVRDRVITPAQAIETLETEFGAEVEHGTMCERCLYVRTVWSVCPNGCDTSELLKAAA